MFQTESKRNPKGKPRPIHWPLYMNAISTSTLRFLAHLYRQVTDYLWLRVLVAFDLQHHLCNARVNDAGKTKR